MQTMIDNWWITYPPNGGWNSNPFVVKIQFYPSLSSKFQLKPGINNIFRWCRNSFPYPFSLLSLSHRQIFKTLKNHSVFVSPDHNNFAQNLRRNNRSVRILSGGGGCILVVSVCGCKCSYSEKVERVEMNIQLSADPN